MAKRKLEIKDLIVTNAIPFVNEKYTGITLQWSANIGFGEYQVFFDKHSNAWGIDSEHMDSEADKEFGEMVFKAWLNSIKDVE